MDADGEPLLFATPAEARLLGHWTQPQPPATGARSPSWAAGAEPEEEGAECAGELEQVAAGQPGRSPQREPASGPGPGPALSPAPAPEPVAARRSGPVREPACVCGPGDGDA